MSKISFENFGYIGKKIGFQNSCISSSRYEYQKNYLPKTLSDIINKLSISENDDFLDIGCGLGTFLIPISYLLDCMIELRTIRAISGVPANASFIFF